ncbi:unnamed protein product [Didymodactylos carnosus]|uniref:fructokinase n=1 Tax=Didymodactylos carnosus TaxID=1234261 RepID=A0A814NZ91_9BILA|nr:unnamed protein product [Didymodactylos carnosus]CAF1097875.1 unnamed protein product [Didymodactylos carnosus]CAF3787387.1 unnamed protein product [Didymodactylos carnosus]CAF3862958.1 unnamed protein product [Didymodactylos carnosus]
MFLSVCVPHENLFNSIAVDIVTQNITRSYDFLPQDRVKYYQIFDHGHVVHVIVMSKQLIVAGIELGGTGCKVGISNEKGEIEERFTIETITPDKTLTLLYNWLSEKQKQYNFKALGIASFGPIDLHQNSDTYGYITQTPKPHWQYTNVVGAFKKLNIPIAFDTDVNAPAMTETRLAGGRITTVVYITIGTGVGIGVCVNGRSIHGLLHPEGGHLKCLKFPGDNYEGNCPFHQSCVEGLINSKAIADRLQIEPSKLSTVPDDNPIWNLQAYYLAQLCAAIVCLISAEKIFIGGGLAKRTVLFTLVRKHVQQILNNYIQAPEIIDHIDEYIVPSSLGEDIGVISAFDLAQEVLKKE